PDTRKRFRHFVNSDAPDSTIEFVETRGQIRPATPGERTGGKPVPIPVVAVGAAQAATEPATV
ncbi:hypothetical protein, partial [Bacillus cereus group sp. BC23]